MHQKAIFVYVKAVNDMNIDQMKEKKRELGLTNEKLAELSGVPVGTVQKIFSGETKAPRQNTIRKLEYALNAGSIQYSYADYSPIPIGNRLGVAEGKFEIPDDIDFCNDEIAEMFGV